MCSHGVRKLTMWSVIFLVVPAVLLCCMSSAAVAENTTFVIHPVCPEPTSSTSCLSLSEFARVMNLSADTTCTLQLLPGIHNLDRDIHVHSVSKFTVLAVSASHSDQETSGPTIVSCSNQTAFSFEDIQAVRLRGIDLLHCGDLLQPAVTVSSVGHFEMTNCSVRDSTSAGITANGSSLALHNMTICNSSGSGLTILNGEVVLTGTTRLTENMNQHRYTCYDDTHFSCGGGLAAFNSKIHFLGTLSVEQNYADLGAGMYISQNTTLAFEAHPLFVLNTAYNGGGMYVRESGLIFNGSTHLPQTAAIFMENSAENDGGGVFMQRSLMHCSSIVHFVRNEAQNRGGGIGSWYGSTFLFGSATYISGNRAQYGGGINLRSGDYPSIGTMIFDSNTATSQGGGAYYSSSTVSHTGTMLVSNNTAKNKGGGMSAVFSTVLLDGYINLDGNRAGNIGGGARYYSSTVSVTGVLLVTNNTAAHWGGGIFVFSYTTNTIIFDGRTIISGNTAVYGGGGLDLNHGAVMENRGSIIFADNNAVEIGGAVNVYWSEMLINGSLVVQNNSASQGGGINIESSHVECSGTVVIENNMAEENGGGMCAYLGSSFSISGNINLTNNKALRGGGFVAADQSTANFDGEITFSDNSGLDGGGMVVYYSQVRFSGNTSFIRNTVLALGGGIFAGWSWLAFSGSTDFTSNRGFQGGGMSLQNCILDFDGNGLFEGNTAEYFGGAVMLTVETTCAYCSVATFNQSTTFVNNRAVFGGGLLSLDTNVTFMGETLFNNNSAIVANGNSGYGGGLFSYRAIVYFHEVVTFAHNTALDGGAIYGSYTIAILNGEMSISENSAVSNGGGLYFTSESKFQLMDNATFSLNENDAGMYGGAIYIRDDPFFSCIEVILPTIDYPGEPDCVFQPSVWPTTAKMEISEDNYAEDAGSLLYGGIITRCKFWPGSSNATSQTVLSEWMFGNDTDVLELNEGGKLSLVSSYPVRVCPCNSLTPDCEQKQLHIEALPGETFSISIVAVGQLNGASPSIITAVVLDAGISIDSHQYVQSAHNTCTALEYKVSLREDYDPHIQYGMILHSESPCQSYGIPVVVNITLLPCPSGFELSSMQSMSCVCSKRIQQFTNTCDIDTRTIHSQGGYWIGWDTSSNGEILHPHCPFDYCTAGNISFPLNDTDRQCQHNRAGLICGGCKQGYSVGFGGSHCLRCPNSHFLSLILAFALAGIALVAFLHVFRLTVAQGTINGLVFYANMIAANQAIYFPQSQPGGAFLRTFIAWINLDLGIETCFYRGMDTYSRTWLQFAFPLYIWALVGLVVVLCHYFSWATKMFGSNPIAVLATLFLLSYAKILRAIITAMSFTYLDYPHNPGVPVWLHDGNVKYLEGKHIALILVAAIFFLLLFLPFTLIIFLGQWIEAKSKYRVLRWIGDYRIKSFLDAYYGPMKTDHRYWPGLILASRALLLLVFAFNAFGDPSINLLASVTCIIGLLTLLVFTGSVYKKTIIFVLEVSFLLNTLVLAACTLTQAIPEEKQPAVSYTSISIAFATFIGILIYHGVSQTKKTRIWKATIKPRLRRSQGDHQTDGEHVEQLDESMAVSDTRSQSFVTVTTINLRESVLEDN